MAGQSAAAGAAAGAATSEDTTAGGCFHGNISLLYLSPSSYLSLLLSLSLLNRHVGLVVRCPPRERKIPGSNPACAGIFSGSSHTSDFKIVTPVATLPGAWRSRVSTGTGRPGVSIL